MAYGNFILINGKKYRLYGEPLDSYWEMIGKKPLMCSESHTPGDKGYFAEWNLKDTSLYLTDFITENNLFTKCSYTFKDYFGKEKEPFFAEWFSGEIWIREGKFLPFWNHHFDAMQEYSL